MYAEAVAAADEIVALLETDLTQTDLGWRGNVYVNAVPAVVPVDPNGTAHLYAVLWYGLGVPDRDDEAVDTTPGPTAWQFRVTAVGGDPDAALRAAGHVMSRLDRAQLREGGIIRPDQGVAGRRPMQDPSPQPARWFVPLDFTTQLLRR